MFPVIDTGITISFPNFVHSSTILLTYYKIAMVEYLRTLEDIALYSVDGRIHETDNAWTYGPHPTTNGTTEAAIPVELIAIVGGVAAVVIVFAIVFLRRR
jgi:hypothetical protein